MAQMRWRIWIHSFQTRLMIRIALYLLFFQFTTACVLYSLGRMSAILQIHASDSIFDYVPVMALMSGAFLAAAFLYDAMKLTHRLVGPVLRFKRVMQSIADGSEVAPVRLRKGDMFMEVADTLNQMLKTLSDRGAIVLQKCDSTPVAPTTARSARQAESKP